MSSFSAMRYCDYKKCLEISGAFTHRFKKAETFLTAYVFVTAFQGWFSQSKMEEMWASPVGFFVFHLYNCLALSAEWTVFRCMTLSRQQKIFPALVVLTGIVICFAPCALVLGCTGIYITPVSSYLGVGRGELALYMSIVCLSAMVVMPIQERVLEAYDVRFVLSGAVCLVGVPFLLLSISQELWHFYLLGIVMGIGLSVLLYLAVPLLINRWFNTHVGFFTGLCFAFSGIGGAVFNPIGGYFIALGPEGWRLAYLFFGLVTLLLTLPFTLFCVRSKPSDIDMSPVESLNFTPKFFHVKSKAHQDGKRHLVAVPLRYVVKSPSFYVMLIFGFLVTCCVEISQYFPSYASAQTNFPDVVAASSIVVSVSMAGSAIGKIFLGTINDKLSARACVSLAMACGLFGLICMLLFPGLLIMLYIGAFLFGIFYASANVVIPLFVRALYGTLDFFKIYSYVAVGVAAGDAIGLSIWGFIADSIGFDAIFIVGIIAIIFLLCSGFFAYHNAAKLREKHGVS